MYEEENFPKISSQHGEKSPYMETIDCIHYSATSPSTSAAVTDTYSRRFPFPHIILVHAGSIPDVQTEHLFASAKT